VLVRLGLYRCHWSHILVHQHLTSTSEWPNCGFTLRSLANPSQAAPRSHRPHMVHPLRQQSYFLSHRCQRDRLAPPNSWTTILRETEFVIAHLLIAVVDPVDAPLFEGGDVVEGGKPTMLATVLD
jgi:hypothetical protein